MDKYTYNRAFRLKIIALCLDRAWYTRYGTSLILPDYFEAEAERTLVEGIIHYYEQYRSVPSDAADLKVLCEDCDDLIDEVYEGKRDYDYTLVIAEVIKWAKEQAAKKAVLESVEEIQKGDLSQLVPRLNEAMRVGEDLSLPGIDVVEDVGLWLPRTEIHEKVQTGMYHIDQYLDGGLGAGEELTILSPSNRGKSMTLSNIAYGAAGLGSAKNVVVFTHEMLEHVYAKRFGARTIWRFPKRNDDLEEYEMQFTKAAKLLIPGKIRIISSCTSTRQVEAALHRLESEGFKPDIIIDDYLDLVTPRRRYKERRFELSDTWVWFRELGKQYNVPVVTASQTTRGSYNKEVIDLTDIAEDIGKVNASDIVIALCQTKMEEEQKRCRLFMAKVRDGAHGETFDAKYYGEQQAIITIGVSKRKDVQEQRHESRESKSGYNSAAKR